MGVFCQTILTAMVGNTPELAIPIQIHRGQYEPSRTIECKHPQTALCNYLDVWMEVHEGPLAVFTVDPQGKLHLFVQHNKYSHSLLLSEIKKNR